MSEQTEKDKLETLQQRVKFFDNLLASLIDGIVITDELHNIIIVNEAFCNLLGRRRQEVIETNLFVWLDLLNAGIPPLWTETTSCLYKERLCRDVEFRAQTTHGMRYFSINASLWKNDITGKVCFISIWRDITNIRQAEMTLQESEERFRTITEYANDAIICLKAPGVISLWNKKAEEMFGYSAKETIGKDVHLLIVPEKYREKAYGGLKAFFQTGKGPIIGKTVELSALRRDGSEFPIEISISAINVQGEWQSVGIIRDITERKKSEERYKTIIHTSMDGFWLSDTQGRIVDVNDAYCRLTGYTCDELLTMRIQDIEAMEKPEETVRHIKKIIEKGYAHFETRHRCKDGRIVDIEVSVTYHALIDGQFFAFIRDVTERKRTENTLRENEERYRLVTELTSDFIFKITVSPDGQMALESATKRFTDISGYSSDDVKTPDDWQRIIHTDDHQVLNNFFKTILNGQSNEGKLRIIVKSGEVKWLRLFGRPLWDERKRRIAGVIGAGKDITEYVQAEEERKRLQGEVVEKERFLEAVLQQMPVGVIVAEAPGGKLYLYNKKVAEFLRHPFYPASAVEQYVQYKGFHPDGRRYEAEEWPLARSVKVGETVEGEEIDYLRGDGSHCWLELHSGPICNEQGQRTGAIVSFFDVTRRKQALERVAKLNSFLISIRKINEALVRTKDVITLFHVVCDSLIGVGFVRFAWIGLLEEGVLNIKPIAHAGIEDGFLSSVTLRWDGAGYSMPSAGIAVKTDKPYILIDIGKDQINEEWRKEALKRGYKACIILPLKYNMKDFGVLLVFSGAKEAISGEEINYLREATSDISVGIKSLRLEKELRQSHEKIRKALDGTIDAIAKIVEKRDPYTAGHERRVAQLACAIARELRLPEDQAEGIRITSYLHDIGKVEVPAEILSKPTRLSEIEFSLIKNHPQTGYEILKDLESPWPIAQIILQHQERLDGSGYPNGLKGKEIMVEARILAVADTVEAMSSHRPYRPALGLETALKEITQKKGVLFDPAVVDACLRLFRRKGFRFK